MQDRLEKLKWYKSHLNAENTDEFDQIIIDLLQQLPESYRIKLEPLVFYDRVSNEPLDYLPF